MSKLFNRVRRVNVERGVHGPAAALACLALLAVSACSVVSSPHSSPAAGGHTPAGDQVRLVVSRDYGARVLTDTVVPARPGMTVMRLLAENCRVDTSYGGGFVAGIDGLRSSSGGSTTNAADWFYWVDGSMGAIGAADQALRGGQTVWWDYHRWQHAMFIPAALDAFPAPFRQSQMVLAYKADPLEAAAARWATRVGIPCHYEPRSHPPDYHPGPWIVAGTPGSVASNAIVKPALAAGTDAGVFVTVDQGRLFALTAGGKRGQELRAAAFATPDPDHPGRLCLVLVAQDTTALQALLQQLSPQNTSAHVALGLLGDRVLPLPLDPEASS